MAALGKIRSKGVTLIIIISLGLLHLLPKKLSVLVMELKVKHGNK